MPKFVTEFAQMCPTIVWSMVFFTIFILDKQQWVMSADMDNTKTDKCTNNTEKYTTTNTECMKQRMEDAQAGVLFVSLMCLGVLVVGSILTFLWNCLVKRRQSPEERNEATSKIY